MSDDLIKREDAIKAVEAHIESRESYHFNDYEYGRNQAFETAISELEDLPSADRPQDECSTCEHYNDVGDWCKTCGVSHYTPRMKGADDE